jgi:hypothetical protein
MQTLVPLEPSLISVPSRKAFFTQLEPACEAYASADHAGALPSSLRAVRGLEQMRATAVPVGDHRCGDAGDQ